jgi:hypothetical protein
MPEQWHQEIAQMKQPDSGNLLNGMQMLKSKQ